MNVPKTTSNFDTVVIASGNKGKIREISEILTDAGYKVLTLNDFQALKEPEEPYETFAENAVHKARYYATNLGLPVLADDSGLEVDLLDGAPGVYSARYAGTPCNDNANNALLLARLAAMPEAAEKGARTARFRCLLAFVYDVGTGAAEVFEGSVEGTIDYDCKGENGFGYDVLFVPDGHQQTFGTLDGAIKKGISHRARALAKLRVWLSSQVTMG